MVFLEEIDLQNFPLYEDCHSRPLHNVTCSTCLFDNGVVDLLLADDHQLLSSLQVGQSVQSLDVRR